MPFFDIWYFIILSPALLLAMWAQARVRSTYSQGLRIPTSISGFQAAREILDANGLRDVHIERVHGQLSDHYDPRHRVLRLSDDVYAGHTASSVGIAAHEAGHALQHAHGYGPLAIRNLAVPAAQFGPIWFLVFFFAGFLIPALFQQLIWVAILGYVAVAIFQLINLPVEFDASFRAKRLLMEMGVTDAYSGEAVNRVLNAAAWTYVAATLQSILIVLYYALRFGGLGRDE